MAATYDAASLTTRLFVRSVDFDPDSGSEADVTLNPAASEKGLLLTDNGGPRRYLFEIFRSVGTGYITTASVYACTAADLTGATAVKTITPTTANAVGDHVFVEVDVDQINEVLANADYVGLKITMQTSTDECVVTVIGADGLNQYSGLTSNYIS